MTMERGRKDEPVPPYSPSHPRSLVPLVTLVSLVTLVLHQDAQSEQEKVVPSF